MSDLERVIEESVEEGIVFTIFEGTAEQSLPFAMFSVFERLANQSLVSRCFRARSCECYAVAHADATENLLFTIPITSKIACIYIYMCTYMRIIYTHTYVYMCNGIY